MRNIAIFASGSGTNAENIIKYFSNRKTAKVTLVLSNRREAFVLKRAAENNVKSVFFDRNEFYNSGIVLDTLISNDIDSDIVLLILLYAIKSKPKHNIKKIRKTKKIIFRTTIKIR